MAVQNARVTQRMLLTASTKAISRLVRKLPEDLKVKSGEESFGGTVRSNAWSLLEPVCVQALLQSKSQLALAPLLMRCTILSGERQKSQVPIQAVLH